MKENEELQNILTTVSNTINNIAGKLSSLFIKTSPQPAKKKVLSPKRDKVNKEQLIKDGKLHKVGELYISRTPNTSRTSEISTKIENAMYNQINRSRSRNNYRTTQFNIPYGDRTITIRPTDATIPLTISVNALDSLAKNAGRANESMLVAMGLPYLETTFGKHPVYNYELSGFSDNELGNSNFFKAFRLIPAEYLVRNFRYNGEDVSHLNFEDSQPVSLNLYPLEHAFMYFDLGKYNPGDPNHTPDVLRKGTAVLNEKTGNYKKWWNEEGSRYYEEGKKERKNK